MFGLKDKPAVTEDELRSMIKESTESGTVQEVEQDIMERALMLGDQTVNRIMTTRSELVCLHCRMSAGEIKEIVYSELHRGYPLYCENRKEVKGIVLLRDLLPALDEGSVDLEKMAILPTYFPESMTAYDALAVLKSGAKIANSTISAIIIAATTAALLLQKRLKASRKYPTGFVDRDLS